MRIRETIFLLALLFSAQAFASATTSKQIDTVQNSTGGNALSVPSVGSALLPGIWTQEFPSGTCNGSTTSLTLAHTPTVNFSVRVSLDGSLLTQGSGNDYTISGATITLSSACATGQNIYVVYTY